MQIPPFELVKYLVWGVIVLIAQVALAPLLGIRGIHPDLLLIYVVVITSKRGKYAGLTAGFIAGIAQDSITLNFLGVMALSKSSVAFWLGKWLENREKVMDVKGWFVLLIVAAFAQDILISLFILHGSQIGIIEYTFRNTIPVAFYTTIIGLLWFIAPFGKTKGTHKFKPRARRFK